MHAETRRIRLALRREAVQLAEKECELWHSSCSFDVERKAPNTQNNWSDMLPHELVVTLELILLQKAGKHGLIRP